MMSINGHACVLPTAQGRSDTGGGRTPRNASRLVIMSHRLCNGFPSLVTFFPSSEGNATRFPHKPKVVTTACAFSWNLKRSIGRPNISTKIHFPGTDHGTAIRHPDLMSEGVNMSIFPAEQEGAVVTAPTPCSNLPASAPRREPLPHSKPCHLGGPLQHPLPGLPTEISSGGSMIQLHQRDAVTTPPRICAGI